MNCYWKPKCSIKCNFYNRTRSRCYSMYFESTNKHKIRLQPVIYIRIRPRRLPSKIFCAIRNLRYIFLRGEGKHSDTNAKMIGWLDVLWVCKRNSLKAKSKANNQTHVPKLRFRFLKKVSNERHREMSRRERRNRLKLKTFTRWSMRVHTAIHFQADRQLRQWRESTDI